MSSKIVICLRISGIPPVFVKTSRNAKVSSVVNFVGKYLGVPRAKIRLIFRGKLLKEFHLLRKYGVKDDDVLTCVLLGVSREMYKVNRSTKGAQTIEEGGSVELFDSEGQEVKESEEEVKAEVNRVLDYGFDTLRRSAEEKEEKKVKVSKKRKKRKQTERDVLRFFIGYERYREQLYRFHQLLSKMVSTQSQLDRSELRELEKLKIELSPFFCTSSSIFSSIRKKDRVHGRSEKIPMISDITLKIHSRVEEIDVIPKKLKKLKKRMNRHLNSSLISHITTSQISGDSGGNSGNRIVPKEIEEKMGIAGIRNLGKEEKKKKKEKKEKKKKIERKKEEENEMDNPDDILGTVLDELDDGLNDSPVTRAPTSTSPRRRDIPVPFGNLYSNVSSTGSVGTSGQTLNRPQNQTRSQPQGRTGDGVMNVIRGLQSQANPVLRRAIVNGENMESTLSALGSRFGFTEPETRGGFDELMGICTSQLDMMDMLKIMGGDFQPLEKCKGALRKHVFEKLLKKDVSENSRKVLVESWITPFIQYAKNDEEFKTLWKERIKPGVEDPLEIISGTMRFHYLMLLDLILDGYDKDMEEKIKLTTTEKNNPWSAALVKILSFLIYDAVSCLYRSCRSGLADIEKIIGAITKNQLNFVPENLRQSLGSMTNTMITQMVIRKYKDYKEKYPNRTIKRVKFEGILPKVDDESDEDDLYTDEHDDEDEDEVIVKDVKRE